MAHITDGEAAEGRVLGEGFDAEGLGGDKADHGGVAHLDGLGFLLDFLTGTAVDLGFDLGELAGDVGGVAVEDGRVAVADLTGVVEDDDLGEEVLGLLGGVVLGVGADVATADVLDGQVLDVEADVVAGDGLGDALVMHLKNKDTTYVASEESSGEVTSQLRECTIGTNEAPCICSRETYPQQ